MSVLVLDMGSSSVRAMLFDDRARAIPGAASMRAHQFATTPRGAAVSDAHVLRGLAESCIDELLQHPASRSIEAAAMAVFTGSLLGLDADGRVITPVYTYADTRSAVDAHLLDARIDRAATHQRTGCLNHPTYAPSKLHWLRRAELERFQAVRRWLDIATYLYTCWFGDAPCSFSVASWSGLLNRAGPTWDRDWLAVLGLPESHFPRLSDFDDVRRGLTPDYAARWPALRDVPFCLAVGDGAAANVGSGAMSHDRMALTVGTTAALRIVLEADGPPPPVPPGLWSYRLDAAHHVLGGATFEGGNIFRWAQSVLSLPDAETIAAEMAARQPDSHGLTFLPLLGGERSPGWAGDASGAISGLRLSTTALDILQAAYEGVALRLALTAEQLRALVPDGAPVMAGGGALAAAPGWVQTIADALNRPIYHLAEPEITARGAAILALQTLGRAALSDFPPAVERIVQPNPAHAAILRQALGRQAALYAKLISP